VELGKYNESELYEKYKSRFIELKYTYDDYDIDQLKNIIADKDTLIDLISKIQKLKDKILNREVHVLEQKGKLEEVLNVFERINTRNTKLNMFDIMVAKTYKPLDN